MVPALPPKPRVFVDADVVFAGAASASEQSASLIVLRLAELTLLEAVVSSQVVAEAERNLAEKLPTALPAFSMIVARCLGIVRDPQPGELVAHAGKADPKDLPILVAAVRERCPWLVTFNVRHFQPGDPAIVVLRPGDFVLRMRQLLAYLS
jgi:hypothetical protein